MSYTAWSVTQDEIPDATKWNYLGSNDAHFNSFLGMDLEWISWTPTITGITVGNGTKTAFYTRIGNTVFCRIRFNVGSSTTMTAIAQFSLPVTPHADYLLQDYAAGGFSYIEDYLTTTLNAGTRISASGPSFYAPAFNANLTHMGYSGYSTTIPITWATNDYIDAYFFYEAAS